ncbi:MAG: hypothetical protein AAFW75_32360 [Cyanobacteria bacterium J06636_16]
MKHTRQVEAHNGSHESLAEDLGNIYYDSLADFLRLLAEKIQKDGQADYNRGRKKLAQALFSCSETVAEAAQYIDEAWTICEPYMK